MNPVDAYLAALTPLRRERLAAARAAIHAAYDDVAESIEWKMPVYRRGEAFVGTASQKSYISLYVGQAAAAALLAAAPGLKGGKGCVNIPDRADWPAEAAARACIDALAQRSA